MNKRKRRFTAPFEVEIERLGRGAVGVGTAPDGAPVTVRGVPPGSRVLVAPQGRRKGTWQARKVATIRPPAVYQDPPCASFGLCGGCALQELGLDVQRQHKLALALSEIGEPLGGMPPEVRVGPVRGVSYGFGYRNRVELSFLGRRYLSEEAHASGQPIDGRWLGFHAPGRFDRVVDADRCWLVSDALNEVIGAVRSVALAPEAPEPWDNRAHTGFWRHLLLREASTGEILVALFTTTASDEQAAWVERVAGAIEALDLGGKRVVGVIWAENDGVADVARGAVRRLWGRDWVEERLGEVRYRLSVTSFFQTSTEGARVLYDAVGELAGRGGTLVDLYCGIGAIGLYLASRFDRIFGIEENAEAVSDAERNARDNGVANARFVAAKVEDALEHLDTVAGAPLTIVVDPPRVGLHPRVARKLAETRADVLVYVACNPASLGRDAVILAEGGWRLTDVQIVDLFPQTGHVEAIGRFVRADA